MKKVAVIMGSDSDWPVVKAACTQLKEFGIPYEAHILSAHRTPAQADTRSRVGARETALAPSSAPRAWPPTWPAPSPPTPPCPSSASHEGRRHGRS